MHTSLVWLLKGMAPKMTVESILSYQRLSGPSRRLRRRMEGKYRILTIPLWNIEPPTVVQNQLTTTPKKWEIGENKLISTGQKILVRAHRD